MIFRVTFWQRESNSGVPIYIFTVQADLAVIAVRLAVDKLILQDWTGPIGTITTEEIA